MKILYVSTVLATVNSFFVPHINQLLQEGHDVDVAANTKHQPSKDLVDTGCKIHSIPFQRSPFKKENIRALRKIKELILENQYDVVHVHTPVASLLTRLACKTIPNVKMIYTAHGFHFFKGSPVINWALYYPLEKIAARWTDTLITMNDEDYMNARKFTLRRKNSLFKVHGVGINLDKFTPQFPELKYELRNKYKYQKEDFILIYVGELSKRKNQGMILDVIHLLKDRIPRIKLLLAGSGGMRDLYQIKANQLGISHKVEFLGFRTDIPELMLLSDIAVSTSKQEGLPVNVMEAMATGLPLVVSNCRGNRDLVDNGVNGWVFNLNRPEECANAIENLYNSKDKMSIFSKNNREKVKNYSIGKVNQELMHVYQK